MLLAARNRERARSCDYVVSSSSVAGRGVHRRATCPVARRGISPCRDGSLPAHSPHGATSSADDGGGPADSSRRVCDRIAEWPQAAAPGGKDRGKHRYASSILLARRHGRRDRMACSRAVRNGHAVGRVACIRTRELSSRRPPLLVSRDPALAGRRKVSTLGSAAVAFPRYVTVRCALGVPHVLRPRGLSALFVYAPALRYFSSRRPGMCGRPDVGLGHVCLSRSRGCNHHSDAFTSATRLESGGALKIATMARQSCPQRSLDGAGHDATEK